ncbi:SMI1/KNR4 family protein (plasmid) [Rhodococcus qingshengii]|uniref:SMI1/KNR4 family protein n=1 Tax=Rhodococcus qingshengii TaxID=334542 RepID=UPI002112D674|nr:SMI1/KNR4 family protein [Rhodococcus qingshengii]UUE28407.1 SMI1/KNR4 family protein [Rhodococcus qingshengii]
MTYWAVARPDSGSGEVLVRDGYVVGDDAAIAQIADVGVQFATADDGSRPMIWVSLGSANARVSGFGDQSLGRTELEAEIRRCVTEEQNAQRRADVEAMIDGSSHARRSAHSTPAGSVRDQWNRITEWLRVHFPGMTITGAERDRVDAAIERTGQRWPAELIELYTLVDGVSDERLLGLLHRFALLTLDDVLRYWESSIQIWDESARLFGDGPVEAPTEAGFQADTFLPDFVPFAGMDGNFLCVDTRPGSMHGCVTEFDKTGADEPGPRWVSISAMLTDLADSLTTSQAFDDGWYWTSVNGALEWEPDRTWRLRQLVKKHLSRPAREGPN